MAEGLKLGFVGLLITLLSISCDKDKDYPITPYLEFKEYAPSEGTNVTMRCYFRDGDGDIGTDPGNDANFDCAANPDITVYYQELEEGVWNTELEIPKCKFSLTPEGQDKTLEGDILFNLEVPARPDLLPGNDRPNNDSVRYSMVLRDRAGHVSNEVFGPLIVTE